ncbi:uncharacterized protein LOC142319916 [Lycorma delicatula]|uniref:uncharacterized protein LOC142319916 n=1 Tax=Lycorma delicatula TaxID=130591 RepID=UPI003F51804F
MVTADMLDIGESVSYDNTITQFEYHTHLPYASSTYNNNDEIRIPIHQQDVYTLPHKSLLMVEGTLITKIGDKKAVESTFTNNTVPFLFEEIRYEINGTELCRVQKLGITTTIKNILLLRKSEENSLENFGWKFNLTDKFTLDEKTGRFCFYVPLRMLMGFAEDYKHIILNVKQELVLLRSSSDVNALVPTKDAPDSKLKVIKVAWKIPYVHVTDTMRLQFLKFIERDRPLAIAFRTWQIHEYPALPQTNIHSWTVRTCPQMEKPRYGIIGLQTDRKDKATKTLTNFDLCELVNVRLYLNSQYYPYDNLQGDINMMYEMFASFHSGYYKSEDECPAYSLTDFQNNVPLIVIDCSKQNESLKTGTVDVRIDFETKNNIPANTAAYCLIILDTIVTYTPLTRIVRKVT